MERITISLDDDLLEKFDLYIQEKGYTNRSEGFRDAIRHLLSHSDQMDPQDEECLGCVSYVYDHKERMLSSKLVETQHHHHSIPTATLHLHVDENNCFEATVLRGKTSEVRSLADQITSQTGVKNGHLHLVPIKPI
ncbi:nickel-responsive transcriptional regulator NikR [Curvivirga sp.]|uniref:nickel-responsive transcriptional regulator NikR n=1 Tax=Curvivirga sp. TaxID=2856848 RepID=UPI003B58D4AD